VAYKTLGGNAGAVVVPHMNWRGLFSTGTNAAGGTSLTAVEWPGFRTTAYHSMGETQSTTKNWMGSLLEGQRDAGGQMYMRNRYYDPATGQFTQTDPIGIAGGLNTYGFGNGDPVSYDDPYGLCPPCRGNENTPEAVEREAQMVENRSGRDALIEGATVALGVGGGVAFLAASTEAAIASAPTLAARARELHGALSAATQRRTTTAVARVVTQNGRIETWVASSERVLRPAQRALLRGGERAVRGSGHAETTIINAARAEGATVEVIAASRPICPSCARAIEGARALFGSILKN
jgi:RHS repeat-associated protein